MYCNLIIASVKANATKTVRLVDKSTGLASCQSGVIDTIRSCLLVQDPIVYSHPEGSILFPSKKNGDPIRGGVGPDTSFAIVLIQLFSDFNKFYR